MTTTQKWFSLGQNAPCRPNHKITRVINPWTPFLAPRFCRRKTVVQVRWKRHTSVRYSLTNETMYHVSHTLMWNWTDTRLTLRCSPETAKAKRIVESTSAPHLSSLYYRKVKPWSPHLNTKRTFCHPYTGLGSYFSHTHTHKTFTQKCQSKCHDQKWFDQFQLGFAMHWQTW